MPTLTKAQNRRFGSFERQLTAKRNALLSRLNSRLGSVSIDLEPDDEGALATSNFAKDLELAALEREQSELAEITEALRRIESGDYGTCEVCGESIREARLQALPWARRCIDCVSQD